MEKYKIVCFDGTQDIEIVYWNNNGITDGEVYFRGIDLIAQMTDSSFKNPITSTEYELHAPRKPLNSEYAILMVTRQTLCDRQVPVKVE